MIICKKTEREKYYEAVKIWPPETFPEELGELRVCTWAYMCVLACMITGFHSSSVCTAGSTNKRAMKCIMKQEQMNK